MPTSELREFFTYGDHCCSIVLHSPLPGTEKGKNPANTILRAIVGSLAKHASGLEGCLEYSIELDPSAYAVHIVGTPVTLSRVDGAHCGFTLNISIFPRFAIRDDEKNGRLVDDNGYRD